MYQYNITAGKAVGYTNIGKRNGNQDAIFPPIDQSSPEDKIWLVCDGMGGHLNGEVASRLTAETIYNHLSQCHHINESEINEAVHRAVAALNDYDPQGVNVDRRMGTTMTLMALVPEGVLLAHIGDSRMVHLRGQQILFQSEDHKQVNLLLKKNIITEEEAKGWSKSELSRAITAGASDTLVADVYITDNVQEGDLFFLCSDGVLEALSSDELLISTLCDETQSLGDRIKYLEELATEIARDNHTAYLIPIQHVEKKELAVHPTAISVHEPVQAHSSVPQHEVMITDELIPKSHPDPHTAIHRPAGRDASQVPVARNSKMVLFGVLLAFLLAGLTAFFWIKNRATDTVDVVITSPEKPQDKPSNIRPNRIDPCDNVRCPPNKICDNGACRCKDGSVEPDCTPVSSPSAASAPPTAALPSPTPQAQNPTSAPPPSQTNSPTANPNLCGGNICKPFQICKEGKCVCKDGYTGPTCEKQLGLNVQEAKDGSFFILRGADTIVKPRIYDKILTPKEGRIAVREIKSQKYGYLDANGKIVIKPIFDDAQQFKINKAKNPVANVTISKSVFEINKDGKCLNNCEQLDQNEPPYFKD